MARRARAWLMLARKPIAQGAARLTPVLHVPYSSPRLCRWCLPCIGRRWTSRVSLGLFEPSRVAPVCPCAPSACYSLHVARIPICLLAWQRACGLDWLRQASDKRDLCVQWLGQPLSMDPAARRFAADPAVESVTSANLFCCACVHACCWAHE